MVIGTNSFILLIWAELLFSIKLISLGYFTSDIQHKHYIENLMNSGGWWCWHGPYYHWSMFLCFEKKIFFFFFLWFCCPTLSGGNYAPVWLKFVCISYLALYFWINVRTTFFYWTSYHYVLLPLYCFSLLLVKRPAWWGIRLKISFSWNKAFIW